MTTNPRRLLELRYHPHEAARLASARRRSAHGDRIVVRDAEALPSGPAMAVRTTRGPHETLSTWPTPRDWAPGDRWILRVGPESAEAFATYVACDRGPSALPEGCSVTGYSPVATGLHPLWVLAALRLALPPHVRVEVRHDLVGIRLAQLALHWGPDTLAGPIERDRALPLAGLPRPSEASRTGLYTLVRHAGLTPVDPVPGSAAGATSFSQPR